MRTEGPSRRRMNRNVMKETMNMIAVAQGKEAPFKPRTARGKDKGPRDLVESRFRKEEVLPYLRKLRRAGKLKFYRIENGLPGYKGISDFLIFSFITKKFIFCELKSPTGTQSDDQIDFERTCKECGITYVLADKLNHIKMWVEML